MHIGSCTATRVHDHDADANDDLMYIDPLDPDSEKDVPIVVTRRQLIRLAVVSTEVGARFQRESVEHDGMAWMLAPRTLFGGRDAIEASLEQQHCVRAIVLHGLGLGLDAHPADIDDLITERAPKKRSRRGRGMPSKRNPGPGMVCDRRHAPAN